MDLLSLSKKILERALTHAVLIYGHSKSGKTRLAGTAARIPAIKRIIWFDGENGFSTLLSMGLTDEELSKITIIRIPDTKLAPRFYQTLEKVFINKTGTDILVCEEHGRVSCKECIDANLASVNINLASLGKEDLVVIDSLSQLSSSAMNIVMANRPIEAKPEWDDYTNANSKLAAILSVVQAAATTNFLVITHAIAIEEDMNGVKSDRYFPLCGTKAFSTQVGKFFGEVIFTGTMLGKHTAGSSSTYRTDCLTGSRTNTKLEKESELSMTSIFKNAGMTFSK